MAGSGGVFAYSDGMEDLPNSGTTKPSASPLLPPNESPAGRTRGGLGKTSLGLGILALLLQLGSGWLRDAVLRVSFSDGAGGGSYDAVRAWLFAAQGVWCALGLVAVGLGIAAAVTGRARVAGIVGIVAGAITMIMLLA